MYNYTKETIRLLGSKAGYTSPLVKIVADKKGIKVFGSSKEHGGTYAHAEKYAEDDLGKIDTTQGHLHFRDKMAGQNWQDEVYQKMGRRIGIRGGCQPTPPLDDLGGYLPVVSLGFSIPNIVNKAVRQRYYRDKCFIVDLEEYKYNSLYVDILLKGKGSQQLFSDFETINLWKQLIYDQNEPNIIFLIKCPNTSLTEYRGERI